MKVILYAGGKDPVNVFSKEKVDIYDGCRLHGCRQVSQFCSGAQMTKQKLSLNFNLHRLLLLMIHGIKGRKGQVYIVACALLSDQEIIYTALTRSKNQVLLVMATGNQEGKCDSSEVLQWLRALNVRIWTRSDLNSNQFSKL